jgi:chromosome segregation ATPase
LWGISGGTILSVFGWVGLLLFEQYCANLAELRTDLKHFNEVSGDLVRNESLKKLVDRISECTADLEASNTERAALQQELEASDHKRRVQARQLQELRERLASVEGRQSAGFSR